MPAVPAPLPPDRLDAVVAYFRRALRMEGAPALVQPGRDADRALRALEGVAAEPVSERAAAVGEWLREWMTPAARRRCFGALRATAFREAHAGLARPQVPGRTWQKLAAFAGRAGVSPQAALEGLVEFVLVEPARRAAAERHIQIRSQVPRRRAAAHKRSTAPKPS